MWTILSQKQLHERRLGNLKHDQLHGNDVIIEICTGLKNLKDMLRAVPFSPKLVECIRIVAYQTASLFGW